MSERNTITELWDDRNIKCNVCKAEQSVLVDPDRWVAYMKGGLVQEVWPEASPAYREQIIGMRSGYHVCDPCWNPTFGEEELGGEG